jgi:hypothetical protein
MHNGMVMMTPVPDMPGSELVFRRDRQVRLPLLRRGVAGVVFAGLAAAGAATKLGTPMLVVAGVIGLCALGLVASYAVQGTFRTVLTPHGIELRGYMRHFIPWAEVAGFRVRHGRADVRDDRADPSERIQVFHPAMRWPGPAVPEGTRDIRSSTVTVQVVRTSGRRLVLPAPVVSGPVGDSQFSDLVRQLEQWRQRYGPPAVAPAR